MIKVWNSFTILIVLAMLVLLAPAAVLMGPPEDVALAQAVTEELEVTFTFNETAGGAWHSFTAGSAETPVTLNQYTRPQVNYNSTIPGCGFREYTVGTGTVSGDLSGTITIRWNMWRFNTTYPYTPVYYPGGSMFGFMFGRMEVDCGGGNTFILPFIIDLGGNVNMVNAAGKGVTASYNETGAFAGHKIMGNIDMTKSGTTYSGALHIRNYPSNEIFYQGVTHIEGETIWDTRDIVAESCELVYFNSTRGNYHTEQSTIDEAGLEEMSWGEEEAGGAAAKYVTDGPIGAGGYVDVSRNSFVDAGVQLVVRVQFEGVICQKLCINDTYAMTGDDNTTHGLINQLLLLDMPYQDEAIGEYLYQYGYGITPYGLWEPCTESYEGVETFGIAEVGVKHRIIPPYNQSSDTDTWACYPHPKVFLVEPAFGDPGEDIDVNITGLYFLKAKSEYGGTIDFGENITVNSYTVDNSTHITANISIAGGATPGARDVNMTNCYGIEGPSPVYQSGVLADGFTIVPPYPCVMVSPKSGLVTTEGGGSDTFTMRLGVAPIAQVTINISSDDPSEGNVSPGSVTFQTWNWDTPQVVTVTGVDDLVTDGSIVWYAVTSNTSSSDTDYNNLDVADVEVTNLDDDGLTVTPTSGLTTTELGGTDNFSISLWSEPIASVSIGLTSDDLTEGTVSPSSVTFGAGNWSTPQVVTVVGVDDVLYDGYIDYNIVTALVSADPLYDWLDPPDVGVQNEDDERFTLTMAVNGSGTTDPAVGVYDYVPFTGETITATPNAGHMFVDWSIENTTAGVSVFSETFPNTSGAWDGTNQDNPWSVNNGGDAADVRISTVGGAVNPPNLYFEDCDGAWNSGWATTSIDLSGHSDVSIEYDWRTSGNDGGEGFRSEYSPNGGTTWYTMFEHLVNQAWTLDHYDIPDSHATADFVLRFNAAGSASGDYSFIDTVTVTGDTGTQWTDTNNPLDVFMGSNTTATANFGGPCDSTLDGHLSFPGNNAGRVMTVRFYDNSTQVEEVWSPKSATTDADGNFTITCLAAGTYDVSVKNWTCLTEVERGIVLTHNTTTYVNFGSSREGDSNDDNGVSIVDISILIAAYGTTPGDGDWNANCDYNRDSGVSIADISILIANYGDTGDPYP